MDFRKIYICQHLKNTLYCFCNKNPTKGFLKNEVNGRMAEEKSGLYITTIVGVVAVLALVLLYLKGGALGAISDGGATGLTVYGESNTRHGDVACSDNGKRVTGLVGATRQSVLDECYSVQRYVQEGAINMESFRNSFKKVEHCAGGKCFLLDASCAEDGVSLVQEVRSVSKCVDGRATEQNIQTYNNNY